MSRHDDAEIRRLLEHIRAGDHAAQNRLFELLYEDLRRLAHRHLRGERRWRHGLQTTSLAHEAYMRMVRQEEINWRDRVQFFAVAATAIRRVLVDHIRKQQALKAGGNRRSVPLHAIVVSIEDRGIDLIALDEALQRLERRNALQAQIVELRFFGGLTIPEVAEVVSRSPRKVDQEWHWARGLLHLWLKDGSRNDEYTT